MDGEVGDPVTLVVHELRAPLGLLATAATLLSEECTDLNLRARSRVIEESALRLLRTTETILEVAGTLARREAPGLFSPVQVAAQLVENARQLGCDMVLRVNAGDVDALAMGDPRLMEALLQSLLNNAIDHGDAESEISVSAQCRQDDIRLLIENQLASVDRHRGHGIGALISSRLAEACGARVRSGVQDGRFVATVTLLRAREEPARHSPPRAPWRATHRPPRAAAASV